jgi:hypothetical protein
MANLLNCKIPDAPGKARLYWPAKHLFTEWENVAGRPPELPHHTENDFLTWLFLQLTEASPNDRLKCDLAGQVS